MENLKGCPWSQEMRTVFGKGGSPCLCHRALVCPAACMPGVWERRVATQSFPTPETLCWSGHRPLGVFKVERERVRERAAPPCPWAGREKLHAEDDNVMHQRRQPVHSICYSIILVKCLGIFPSHDLFSTQPFYVPLLHFGVS